LIAALILLFAVPRLEWLFGVKTPKQ